MSRTPLRIGAVVVAAAATALSFTPLVQAAPAVSPACDTRVNNTHAKLMECITLEGVREHQAAFQSIADANGGTRAAGTPGYDASVDYVVEQMETAGYDVTLDEFPFTYVAAATAAPDGTITATYGHRSVHRHRLRHGDGERHRAVDINLGRRRATRRRAGARPRTSPASRPATSLSSSAARCTFGIKATNAQAAGAARRHHLQPGQQPPCVRASSSARSSRHSRQAVTSRSSVRPSPTARP